MYTQDEILHYFRSKLRFAKLRPEGEEQSKRFEERVTDKEKQWKYRDQDLEEAKKWGKYMETYEEIFAKCNAVPWHIVPSDQNWYKEHYIARIVVEKLETLGLKYPGFVEEK